MANKKIDNFFVLHTHIASLVSTNKDFDIFLNSEISYHNFDDVQEHILHMKNTLHNVEQNALFKILENTYLRTTFAQIKKQMHEKIALTDRLISKNAVLSNSFRYIQKITTSIDNKKSIPIYSSIMGIDHNTGEEIEQLNANIKAFIPTDANEKLFISHAKIIVQYYRSIIKIKHQSKSLNLKEQLKQFKESFLQYSSNIMDDLKDLIWVLILSLFVVLMFFLYHIRIMTKKQIELNRFRQAVQNSDNIIVITDKNQKIRYVNEAFEKTTGYRLREVFGKTPALLKSYKQPESFYEELKETIYSGKKWQGEFINKNKSGELSYEKASITPILNEKGEVEEFLAIKLDITQEKKTQELLKEKEHLLAQQSKMIAMREMLESIAHQWRQPLSTISTAASGLKLNKEFETLKDEDFEHYMDVIVENTFFLSKTIDNFKNYFNTNNEKTIFSLNQTVDKLWELVGYRFKDRQIDIVRNIEDITLEGLENELIQAMVNVMNNSLEAFERSTLDKSVIFIDIRKTDRAIEFIIKDNAGGIDEDIIEHVFEPYFTTKHQNSGTGVGLYMSYEIIVKHFKGSIRIENRCYEYQDKTHKGAEIIIEIPFKKDVKEQTPINI